MEERDPRVPCDTGMAFKMGLKMIEQDLLKVRR